MFLSRQLALSVTSRRYLRGGQRRVVQQRARHLSSWRALDQSAQAKQDNLILCSSQESVVLVRVRVWDPPSGRRRSVAVQRRRLLLDAARGGSIFFDGRDFRTQVVYFW